MTDPLEIQKQLQEKFDPTVRVNTPSTAREPAGSDRLDSLLLPVDRRGRMPVTQDKYLIRENPQLVQWERETRKFLRNLSPEHGHRISAVMVYEWATGIEVAELMKQGGTASPDLKKINQILKFYFGDSYQTYIAGRKVGKCYKVPPGYYIRRHRPMTLALWAEQREGTLYP